MKKLTITLFCLLLMACAGTAFKWDDARRLQVGMTTSEVESLIGKPNQISVSGDVVRYVWVWVNLYTGTRTLRVDFKDDKVIAVPPIPTTFKD
jgi:hypothetical protein